MSDSKLAQKARTTTQIAQAQMKLALDDEDYLLGWQDVEEAYRYCHNFEDGEVDALIDAVSDQALVVDRYRSDGRTGALNTYIVLQRM